jgi:hypothetical protein
VASTGVHDDARRLVHDEQMLVVMGDPEHELRDRRPLRYRQGLERDLLPLLDPVALRAPLTVDRDRPGGQQPLGVGAGAELVERREKAVEPRPRELSGNEDADDRRSPRRPAAGRRRPR